MGKVRGRSRWWVKGGAWRGKCKAAISDRGIGWKTFLAFPNLRLGNGLSRSSASYAAGKKLLLLSTIAQYRSF